MAGFSLLRAESQEMAEGKATLMGTSIPVKKGVHQKTKAEVQSGPLSQTGKRVKLRQRPNALLCHLPGRTWEACLEISFSVALVRPESETRGLRLPVGRSWRRSGEERDL